MSHEGARDFNDDGIPCAYLITFRCFGIWLHGDERRSTDRFHNRYGTPFLPRNEPKRQYELQQLAHPPVELDAPRRTAVETAIRET